MSMLVNGRPNVNSNNVPLASLVAQKEHVDVNFIKNNNYNNSRPYPANGNSYGRYMQRQPQGEYATWCTQK
jgi:hypothetical protein